MSYFYIGSRALETLLPEGTPIRKVNDLTDYDILVHSSVDKQVAKERFKQRFGNRVEIHHCDILWHEFNSAESTQRYIDILFTLKVSHVMFHKHHKSKEGK